ncbi:MAG: hypothetical protein PHAS_01752 [Phascolarctobacterium sp.]
MITTEEIKSILWEGANALRGSMDASRYKDYMLGLMFYKFLSDKTLDAFKQITGMKDATEKELVIAYAEAKIQFGKKVDESLQKILGYFVAPEYLYQTWINDINAGEFEVQKVTDSLNNFERTIAVSGDSDDFKGLFSNSTIDLTDTALGSNLNERSRNIKALISLFADFDMVELQKGDILGDAYEYLIGQFAMESGKKAGEFYTPRQVSEVMAQIVAKSATINSIYDPTVGSGSLLLTVKKHLPKDSQRDLNYYGQEKNTATYNLTRMNLLLHGVRPEKMTIKNGDTLAYDWPEDPEQPNEGVLFDAVVMNPPYSVKDWNRAGLKVSDPRFEICGVLPPDSKGDFAFLLHGLYHLSVDGTMAIVLPHGVLFRGGTEGEIRERLIKKNLIDAVIGLPNNLFTNTGIPVLVMVLKKNRALDEPILIIDASKNFIKVGKQNLLQEKDIAKIVDIYVERKEEAGYSCKATLRDLQKNDYNLNIPRYVETEGEQFPQDVDAHLFGGIPKDNIASLKVLQAVVPMVLHNSLREIRPNYMELVKPIDEITNEILADVHVVDIKAELRRAIEDFVSEWFTKLKNVDDNSHIPHIMETMLVDIKRILSKFDYLNIYDGYQIVAEIWKETLTHDAEIIAGSDFYTAGRTRAANMVIKGSGKDRREEQDGWTGLIVPNDLIAKHLYADELAAITDKKQKIEIIESDLDELIEAVKAENGDEADILGDMLNEAATAFEIKKIKSELKKVAKSTIEYNLLRKVEKFLTDKSSLSKEVKADEKALREAVEERILILTDEEIDSLVFEKWFGGTVEAQLQLVDDPIKKELELLKMLEKRYAETLTMLDEEIKAAEKAFELLSSELVVEQ